MLKFILRRCLEAIPTLFILITISFFMMRLAPGSPFTGERTLPPEVMANIEAKYHLNDPIMTQYFSYLKQLAHGDFGPSFKYKDYSVNDLVASSFPVSAKLGAAAFFLAVILGVSAGVIAALKQNTGQIPDVNRHQETRKKHTSKTAVGVSKHLRSPTVNPV